MVSLWSQVVNIVFTAVSSVFGWFSDIIDAIPGSWTTILSFFAMLSITRFLLGSVAGTVFGTGAFGFLSRGGSDHARRSASRSKNSNDD